MIKLREISKRINFRTVVKDELLDIELELLDLKPIYEKLLNMDVSYEIKEGSRVILNGGINKPVNGRVLAIKRGQYSVHRDGFVGTINVSKDQLGNLSIGPVAELERQIWVLEHIKSKLNGHLRDAEIPEVLLKVKHNYIQVVDCGNSDNSYRLITFISSIDKLSYRLKVSPGLINGTGYYQIEMGNGDIKSVLISTREIFENIKS